MMPALFTSPSSGPEFFGGRGERMPDRVSIGDVRRERQDSSSGIHACFLRARGQGLGVAVQHDDVGALAQQYFDDAETNPLCGTGDDNAFFLQAFPNVTRDPLCVVRRDESATVETYPNSGTPDSRLESTFRRQVPERRLRSAVPPHFHRSQEGSFGERAPQRRPSVSGVSGTGAASAIRFQS